MEIILTIAGIYGPHNVDVFTKKGVFVCVCCSGIYSFNETAATLCFYYF